MNETIRAAKTPSRKQFTPGELAAIVLIIGVLIALLLPAVAQQRHPNGPWGRMIPNEPPDEANRIAHSSGLSIIAPENWDRAEFGPGEIFVGIHARGKGRIRSQITIYKAEPSNTQFLNGAREFEFQGYPACEKTVVERESSFDDPAYSSHSIYVNQNENWWSIELLIQKRLDGLPEEFRPYLKTIRFPENTLADREPRPDDTE